MVPQVPGRHVARPLAGPLEVLIRSVDLQLRGAGGVERAGGIPAAVVTTSGDADNY